MNTKKLFEFQVLAQVLHYGKAAEKLYMTQSVLSRHIQDLEKEIGAPLFVRGPHGVELTNAGDALYRMLLDFTALEGQSRDRLRLSEKSLTGSVNFGCLRPVMQDKLEDFFGRIKDNYPQITFSADIIDNLNHVDASEFDFIALPSTALSLPDCFKIKHIFYEKCWLVIPFINKFEGQQEVSIKQLANETLFLPGYMGNVGSFSNIAHQAELATGGRINIVNVSTPETALVNVNLNRGYTILPRHRLDERKRNINHLPLTEDFKFETIIFHNQHSTSEACSIVEDEMIKWMENK